MTTLYLCFANSDPNPLPTLRDEQQDIKQALLKGASAGHFYVLEEAFATTSAMVNALQQIRKLIAPDAGNTADTFFDRYNTRRLEQCVVAYSTIVELLMYVMLAQLWDEMTNKKVTALPAAEANELRRYFTMPKAERAKYSLRNVVHAVRQVFDSNNIPYFVEELQPVAAYAADDNHPFAKACVFFESVRLKLASGAVEDQEGEYLAVEAEAELCQFIKPLGFLAKYGMISIKDISIFKNRFYPTPKYQHKMTKLEQRFVGLVNTVERYDQFIENASVIISSCSSWAPKKNRMNLNTTSKHSSTPT